MTISNHPSLEDFARMPIDEIVKLSAEDLHSIQIEADKELKKAKARMAWLDSALLTKYRDKADTVRRDAGKDFGIARFTDGEITIVAELPKKVEWDQQELSQLIEHINATGDDPSDYIDVTLSVSERKYAIWPERFRTMFRDARTVSGGRQTFKLTVTKETA